jgi:hydroxymethylpyrimidine pyrophosphatase-like HAD family hydrolase
LNTGKPASSLDGLFDELEIQDPAITLTGGLIVQRDAQKRWRVIKGHPFPVPALQSLARLFQGTPVTIFVNLVDRNLIFLGQDDQVNNQNLITLLKNTHFSPYEIVDHSPLANPEILSLPVYAVKVNSHDEALLASMYSRMRQAAISGIQFHNSAVSTIDIHAADTSKMIALQYIASQLNIPPSQVIALGDNETDLAAVQWAGYGAIMANGPSIVRARAPHIVPGNQESGVAQVLNQYLFKE